MLNLFSKLVSKLFSSYQHLSNFSLVICTWTFQVGHYPTIYRV